MTVTEYVFVAAVTLALGEAVALYTFVKLLRETARAEARERRAWETERSNLLDRIMLLAGTPWTPPPVQPDMLPADDREPLLFNADEHGEYE